MTIANAARHDHPRPTAPAPGLRRPARAGLTRDQEIDLAPRAAGGDRAARDLMVEANLGLVRTIAREFRDRGLEKEDLIGEGNLGLFRAVERFDPGHGVRFSTYAAYWIKQAIRDALMVTTPAIRLPAWMVGLLTRWRRAERALGRELGRPPLFEEVADAMDLSAEQRTMVRRALESRRLRPGRGDDDAGPDSLAGVADGHPTPDRLEGEDQRALVRRRMGRLNDRERTVVSLRYGLEGATPLTLKKIGKRLGVTREWVRKIELKALAKLREE